MSELGLLRTISCRQFSKRHDLAVVGTLIIIIITAAEDAVHCSRARRLDGIPEDELCEAFRSLGAQSLSNVGHQPFISAFLLTLRAFLALRQDEHHRATTRPCSASRPRANVARLL